MSKKNTKSLRERLQIKNFSNPQAPLDPPNLRDLISRINYVLENSDIISSKYLDFIEEDYELGMECLDLVAEALLELRRDNNASTHTLYTFYEDDDEYCLLFAEAEIASYYEYEDNDDAPLIEFYRKYDNSTEIRVYYSKSLRYRFEYEDVCGEPVVDDYLVFSDLDKAIKFLVTLSKAWLAIRKVCTRLDI